MASITVPGLKPAEVEDMKAAFTCFDKNLRGGLNKTTLATFYKQFGKELSDEDLTAMISEFTGDNKTMIDFPTFAIKMNEKKSMWGSAFGDAFDLIDADKTGKITKERLQQVMMLLGEKLTDEEAEEMIKVGGGSKQKFITALSGDLGSGVGGAPAMGGAAPGRGARGGARGGRGGARGGRGARGARGGAPALPRGARGGARPRGGPRGARPPRLPRPRG